MEFPSFRIWCSALPSNDLSWHSAPNISLRVHTGCLCYRLRSRSWSIHRHWQPLTGRAGVYWYASSPMLLTTINFAVLVVQRIVVAASCVLFYTLTIDLPLGRGGKTGMLVALSFMACIEKLCSIMNLISIEKDWV